MSSKDIGEEWEAELARKIGGRKTPASGSQWHSKLDVRGKKTIWSAKATAAASFRVDADMLREMRTSIGRPGGLGIDTTPILAVRLGGGEEVVVLELDDFLGLLAGTENLGPGPLAPRSRNKQAQLFRENDE